VVRARRCAAVRDRRRGRRGRSRWRCTGTEGNPARVRQREAWLASAAPDASENHEDGQGTAPHASTSASRYASIVASGGPSSVVNLVRRGRSWFVARHLYRDEKGARLGRRTAGEKLSVAQRRGEALDDRCRRLHFRNRTHALAGVHRHRLDVALHARERHVGRVTRYAAGHLFTLLWPLA
jgi:hypothetical protein